jgi:hypothetical protein
LRFICNRLDFTSDAVDFGNNEYSNAMTPVTNGADALVPLKVSDLPFVPRLVIFSPGALNPYLPIEFPKFE